MPRSVTHELTGSLEGLQLRVWERHAQGSMHAIAEGTYAHRCPSGTEHQIAIEARWDVPAGAEPWHGLAGRARDHDASAAEALGEQMVDHAVRNVWEDPCPQPDEGSHEG